MKESSTSLSQSVRKRQVKMSYYVACCKKKRKRKTEHWQKYGKYSQTYHLKINLTMYTKFKKYIYSLTCQLLFHVFHGKMTHAILVIYENFYFTWFIVVKYQKQLKRKEKIIWNTMQQFKRNQADLYTLIWKDL